MHPNHSISINVLVNFYVDNDHLLIYYCQRSIILKDFFGTHHPSHKMFNEVRDVCIECDKLQQLNCSQVQREQSTALIIQILYSILTHIDEGTINFEDILAIESMYFNVSLLKITHNLDFCTNHKTS